MNTENNKNNNIFNDDISIGTIVRVRKSKKNGKLMAYSECGKVILISNQKGLHVGFAEVTSFSDRGNYYIATVKNVAYDFYQDYDENGTTAVPYDEFKEILKTQGFKPEYSEPIDENNVFDVWANLNSGVLITIETWNQDGERGYNSVKCYVPVCGGAFTMRQSTGFSHGSNYLSCFNIVHNTRDFPLHECLEFNDGSMDWHGDTPSLWHYGEGHMGINNHGEQVTLSISEDGIIERVWQDDHRVRVEEYDKEGYHVGESYDGRWTEDPMPIPDGSPLDKEVELLDAQLQRNDDIYAAVTKMCRVLTENNEQEFNMSIVGPIADYAAMLLTREGNKVRFPSVVQDTAGHIYIENYYDDGEVQAI